MSLFKKTFLILITSFLFLDAIHIWMNIYYTQNQKEILIQDTTYFKDQLYKYNKIFNEQYTSINNEFIDSLDKSYQKKHSIYEGYIILDNNLNIIKEKNIVEQPTLYLTDTYISNYLLDDYIQYEYTLKQELKDILEDYFLNHWNYSTAMDISTNNENEITYIKIDGTILYNKRNNEKIKRMYFDKYCSCDLIVNPQKNYNKSTINAYMINIKKYKTELMNNLWLYIYPSTANFEYDNSLIYARSYPLIKKGFSQPVYNGNNQNKDIVAGYIISYNFDYNEINTIRDLAISSNYFSYICSFIISIILSIIVSYVLTKRIKNIEYAAKKITEHKFDIHLDDQSHDELGKLSHSINIMSQTLKKNINELNSEMEEIKKLESVRLEFINNFSHEMKTPLSIINGYISLIDVSSDPNKKEEYLISIEKEIDHMNDLVLSMLSLSRLQSGKIILKIEDVDLDELLIDVINIFEQQLSTKKVIINSNHPVIKADYFELSIVLKNFISNAIKHTRDDHTITITMNDKYISVENEGEQLSPKQMETIWDTYVSSDRNSTGLGLAIAREILELHHFQYDVKNIKNGVCFTIYLEVKND